MCVACHLRYPNAEDVSDATRFYSFRVGAANAGRPRFSLIAKTDTAAIHKALEKTIDDREIEDALEALIDTATQGGFD